MALHEQCVGKTDEWYTPPHVFETMGLMFDVDAASPGRHVTPWIPARAFLTYASLERAWCGCVWLNAPFGGRNGLAPWLAKFFDHGSGVALVPDRTSAPWWQDYAPRADVALAVRGKLKFIGADGKPGTSPAQGTTLLAIGELGCNALSRAAHAGLGSLWRPFTGHTASQTDARSASEQFAGQVPGTTPNPLKEA